MKQEFEMSEEELQAIYDISRNQMPVMFIGVWTGLESKQEQANKLWQSMANKYGFVWDSVEGSAKGNKFFLATPKEKVIPKTQDQIDEETIITLTQKEYKELKKDQEFLLALQGAGVDNWDGYDYAIESMNT